MKRWWLRIGGYASSETRSLVAIGVLILSGVGLSLLTPWPLKLIVDHVLSNKPLPQELFWIELLPGAMSPKVLLAWLAAATVGLFLLSRTTAILRRYVETGAGSRMVYALASDLFSHLQHRSLMLHFQDKAGDLIKRVTADTGCVRELVMRVFVPAVQAVLTLIGMLVIMWQMSPGLAVFALLLSIPLLIIIRLLSGPLSRQRYREQELQGQIYSLAEQSLSAMPLIQAFGREQHHSEHLHSLARNTIGANLRYELSGHQFKVSTAAVTSLATACAMVYGGLSVRDGNLSVGSLLVLLAYFAALYSPLETLAYLVEGFASAKAGSRRVLEIMDEDQQPIVDEFDARPLTGSNSAPGASVRFEDVAFGYMPNRPVLTGVTFDIAAGERVAIVGETGIGKSTLMSLLLRFFDPWHGTIYIDGVDIRRVTIASLRDCIAYMPQKPFLLPLSVAENIAYGRPSANQNEIIAAASAAKADQFIRELPNGYDTVIGERGVTLSNGQKQRLSLARALLKQSRILILDEPTSALDPATEASILEDVSRLFENRTAFVIAHRFSTIRQAVKAIVIEDGRIVEFGPPEELLSAGRSFYRLYQMQFGHKPLESTAH
jgi:ATP-binding cassette subfamily B protein/subfamily B ATP-binding cassette protein MsbA